GLRRAAGAMGAGQYRAGHGPLLVARAHRRRGVRGGGHPPTRRAHPLRRRPVRHRALSVGRLRLQPAVARRTAPRDPPHALDRRAAAARRNRGVRPARLRQGVSRRVAPVPPDATHRVGRPGAHRGEVRAAGGDRERRRWIGSTGGAERLPAGLADLARQPVRRRRERGRRRRARHRHTLPGPAARAVAPMARFDAARLLLERAIAERAFPGGIVEVGTDRDVLWRFGAGTLSYDAGSPSVRDDTIYDLASLTKVLSTATLVMREVERGSLTLDDVLPHLLPGCRNPALAAITVEDVLAHCAGFPAHRPYYQTLEGEDAFEAGICATPLEYVPRSRSIYSDLGFMLLGIVLGRGVALQQRFDAMWTQMATGEDLQFLPPTKWRARTAPTEQDRWRQRMLVGEVHDENAAALGGVAGHAGLFG